MANERTKMAMKKESQDPSESQNDPLQDKFDTLCDLRNAARRSLTSRLSAAGFDDVSEDALLILYAMHLSGSQAHALIRRLGINSQAAAQSLETLILRGYLESRDNLDDPRQPAVVFTERGRAALDEAQDGLRAHQWAEFPLRAGDIIISTTPKSGTTWVQMICALLIFQTPRLPALLSKISPCMEAHIRGRAEFLDELAAQQHRRFLKTHMPLKELPADPRVTYIVIARNPLDVAVSWHHQISELITADDREDPSGDKTAPESTRQWMLDRIEEMGTLVQGRESYFDELLKSLSCAWERRAEPNVVLVHYEDLSGDLPGEMRRLANRLGISVPADKWPSLVQAATFKQMQARADQLQPLRLLRRRDVSKGHAAFFRRGSCGDGRALLTQAEAAHFRARAAQVVPQELLAWLHRDEERSPHPRAGAQPRWTTG